MSETDRQSKNGLRGSKNGVHREKKLRYSGPLTRFWPDGITPQTTMQGAQLWSKFSDYHQLARCYLPANKLESLVAAVGLILIDQKPKKQRW